MSIFWSTELSQLVQIIYEYKRPSTVFLLFISATKRSQVVDIAEKDKSKGSKR